MREVKSFDGGSNMTSVLTHVFIWKRNLPEARLPLGQTLPVSLFSDPYGGNRPDPGDHHAFMIIPHSHLLDRLFCYFYRLPSCLSRPKQKSSEKLLPALLITRLPTLPTGGQAQAGISKEDDTDLDFSLHLASVQSVPNRCNQRFLDFFRNLNNFDEKG